MSLKPDIVDRLLEREDPISKEAAKIIIELRKSYLDGLEAWRKNNQHHAATIAELQMDLKKARK
jgi:hypothetical protein